MVLRACTSAGSSIPVCLHHNILDVGLRSANSLADIKPDNIMIDLERHWTAETIDTWVRANPPRTYAPERSLNKMVSAFVSQSLPPSSLDALPSCNFKLADFSNGTSDEMRNTIAIYNLYYIQLSFHPIKPQTISHLSAYGPLKSC